MNYETYKARIIAQGSYCYATRENWEESQRRNRDGWETVYEVTSKTAALKPGWYKNVFESGEREPMIFGPFATESDASWFYGY